MRISAVRLGGDATLVAYVFRGDSIHANRTWVCLRSEVTPSTAVWIGCWSSKDDAMSAPDVLLFVGELAAKVKHGGRIGPLGPFLEEHYFFDGWDTWGMGTPTPIQSMTPALLAEQSEPTCELADFT